MTDETEVADLARDESDPAAQLQDRERSAALLGAVRGLSPRDRLLLALRFEDDLSAREIAQVTGMPSPFHVYRRLNQLLAQLRGELRRGGMEALE